jgi:hypothetical protein
MNRLAFVVALLGSVAAAQAQTSNDPRWTPWLGCWELQAENLRLPSEAPDTGRGESQLTADAPRPRVCVVPAPPNGATFTTTVAGQNALEQTVVVTGEDRPVDDAECRGTQRAEWSSDGLRLYARAELTCAGDSTPRRVTGLALLAPNGTWLDVQAVQVGGRENVRVRRYRRLAGEDESAAPPPRIAATRLTLDDVKEASAKVSPRAIEAALVETNAAFDLTGRDLVALDEAGVAGSIVDVMVALSYPDRFVVERTRDDRAGGSGGIFLDPFFLDYGFYSPLYGSFYEPYYYSPFAYSYYGRYYDPRFIGYVPVIVDGGSGGRPDEPRPSGAGRAVDGRGYTRVRERAPETASTGAGPAGARARGTSDGAASSSGGSSSGSSSSDSSGGGVSSQGFSSGGSSTDTGRTAVPR